MTQNIYDDPAFFEGYSRLNRSIHGLDGAPEWPALRALLPDLHGRRVLDLGCGYGWFSRWAAGQGALVPGGRLVFSIEHPVYTAPRRPGPVSSSTRRATARGRSTAISAKANA